MIFTVFCSPPQVFARKYCGPPEGEQRVFQRGFSCPVSLKANRIAYPSNVAHVPK